MPSDPNEKSIALRTRLASVGILLDEPAAPRAPARSPATNPEERPSPAALRAILRARGAPERDLEWLVATCPSKQHAREYKPPTEILATAMARVLADPPPKLSPAELELDRDEPMDEPGFVPDPDSESD